MQLVANSLSKRYGATVALEGVSITLNPGEVHALVGENGAGKSSLLKILAAVTSPDGGAMQTGGKPYAPASLAQAEAAGVALVFQEANVNPALSIAENIFLAHLHSFRRLGLLDRRRMQREAQALLEGLEADFSVHDDLARLDLGQRKVIEIARALAVKPRLLLLDEATAFLNHREVSMLLRVITRLKASGLGIVFISHHLHEVFEVADCMTVLKDGRCVGSFRTSEINESRLHGLMVGRDDPTGLFPPKGDSQRDTRGNSPNPLRLSLHDVYTAEGAGPFNLELSQGEILGIGGLKDSGGEALMRAIIGEHRLHSGTMRLNGQPFAPKSPTDAWRARVAYLPGERSEEGLILDFTVRENLTLATRPARAGFIARAQGRRQAQEAVATLGIKAAHDEVPCATLSGGNLQKVVLGKCLATRPNLLLLNNPTRGVDVGAKAEIYRILRQHAAAGLAILMVSEDLPELLGLTDRLVVTKSGRVVQSFPRGSRPTEEEVVKWML